MGVGFWFFGVFFVFFVSLFSSCVTRRTWAQGKICFQLLSKNVLYCLLLGWESRTAEIFVDFFRHEVLPLFKVCLLP